MRVSNLSNHETSVALHHFREEAERGELELLGVVVITKGGRSGHLLAGIAEPDRVLACTEAMKIAAETAVFCSGKSWVVNKPTPDKDHVQ